MSNFTFGLDPILREVATKFDECCRASGIVYTIEQDTHNEQGYQLRSDGDVDTLRMSMEEFIADKWVNMVIENTKNGVYVKFSLKPLYEYPEPITMVDLSPILAANDISTVKEEDYNKWIMAWNDKLVIPPVTVRRDWRIVDGLSIACALAKVGGIGGKVPIVFEDQLKYPTNANKRKQKAYRSTFKKLDETFEERLMKRLHEATLITQPQVLATIDMRPTSAPMDMVGRIASDLNSVFDAAMGNMSDESSSGCNSSISAELNKLRASEIASALQYEIFSITAPTLSMHGLSEIFKEHEQDERDHARRLAQRIHELDCEPVGDLSALSQMADFKVEYTTSADEMVNVLMKQEKIAVESYKRVIQMCQDDPTTRLLLEEILTAEEEHLADTKGR